MNSGENKYDFMPINDFASCVAKTILQTKIYGIINICSGKPIKLKSKINEFIKNNNIDIKIEYGKYPSRNYDSKIIYGDNKKIKQILKYYENNKR